MKKYIHIPPAALAVCFSLCSCSADVSGSYSDIISIADFTKEEYASGNTDIGDIISDLYFEEAALDTEVCELFMSGDHSYKSVMTDENIILVQKQTVFQSAGGYVIADRESISALPVSEISGKRVLSVPSGLGYDGDSADIGSCIGRVGGLYLYSFTAGL